MENLSRFTIPQLFEKIDMYNKSINAKRIMLESCRVLSQHQHDYDNGCEKKLRDDIRAMLAKIDAVIAEINKRYL